MTSKNISCPSCGTTNRLPAERLGDSPVCGNCKEPLFQGKPIELNETNLARVLNNNDVPVLVDCWAPWCGPCLSFAPTFARAAAELEPNLLLAKLNTEQNQPVAANWQIRSIPTLILFDKGKEVARVSGALSLAQLKQWLAQHGVQQLVTS